MTNEELVRRYRNNPDDTEAMEQLYLQNRGLLRKLAVESARAFHTDNPDHLEDLISEGTLALWEVIVGNAYDPAKGKLTTYAYPFIQGAMHRWLEQNIGVLSLSKQQMKKIRRAQQLYHDAGFDEKAIACAMNISEAEAAQLLSYNTHAISLDSHEEPAIAEIPLPVVESVEYTVMNKIWLSLLPEIFAQLKARDKYILGHFYGVFGYEKKPPDRLALELELTIDGVYKAKENALRALKALYYGSPLHIWRKAYMDTKKAAREAG